MQRAIPSLLLSAPLVCAPLGGCIFIADGGEGEGEGPCAITATIDEDRTLSPEECEAYAVAGEIAIDADVVVAPGATIQFAPGTGFVVNDTGSLSAVGTAGERITLRGEGAGSWAGINVRSSDPANALAFVDVDGAGGSTLCCDQFGFQGQDVRAAVALGGATDDNGASISIEDSTFTNSGGDGVDLYVGSTLVSFQRNAFSNNDDAPIALPLSQVAALDAASDYLGPAGAENGEPFVVVLAEDLDEDLTIRPIGVDLAVEAGVADIEFSVEATLTIEAGVTLAFDAGGGFKVEETGSLVTNGTPEAPVRIVGLEAGVGRWAGIGLRSAVNTLTHTVVDGGGSRALCCDYFDDGVPAVKANIIVGGAVDDSGAGVSFTTVTLANSADFGLYVFDNATAGGTGTVTFSGNGTDQN